jgi:pimeloyl-ACP methyl ester carboxylesterase
MPRPRTPLTGSLRVAALFRPGGVRHPLTAGLAATALTVLIGVALAPAGSAGAAAAAVDVRSATTVDEVFERDECPVEVPSEHADRVTCHVLIVPERRTPDADPEKTLRLPVAVIESRSGDSVGDPLVFPTSGGPGAGSFSSLWYFLDHADWAGQDRDIILMEQRGDALAEPTLDCPELDVEHFIEDGVMLSGAAADARYFEQVQACRDRLAEEGIDLSAYTSAESATDLVALRAALGYDTWNLYGVSYGARLAMTMMRDHPEGLRSVILDGPFPPNVNFFESLPTGYMTALDHLLAECAAAADCDDAYPQLEASYARLLDDAEENPIPVMVENPADGSPLRLDVADGELTRGLYDALYNADLVRVLPFLIDQLSQGSTSPMLPLAQRNVDFQGYVTEGLDFSVDCAEEAPFNDDARLAEALAADPLLEHFHSHEGFREECAIWAVPALTDFENQAVASEIPTLIMNGGYDPVTPLVYGEAAAAGLTTRFLYAFPSMGHGSVWENWVDPCPASIAEQFLVAPAVEPDSSCIAAMPSTDFLTTDDIYPTTAIYRFNRDVVQDRDPVQIAVATLTAVVLLGTLVYALAYGVAWLIRRRGGAPPGAVLAAGTAAALNVAYAGALAYMVLNTDPLILGFGVPPGMRPLAIAPLVAVPVTIVLTIVVVRAWIGSDGTLFHRIMLTLAAGASIVFAVWLIARGLLII